MMSSSVVRILFTASMLLPMAVSSLAPATKTSAASQSPLFRSFILQNEQRIRTPTPWSWKATNQHSAARRTSRHLNNMQESSLPTTKAAATTSGTALFSVSSSTLNVPVPRGGGGVPSALGGLAVTAFGKFSSFIGASKTRCFIVLLCSIILESYATALSKQAKDTGRLIVFLHACSLYLLWYVLVASVKLDTKKRCEKASIFTIRMDI